MQNIQETRVQSLSWEDALEEGMATHSRGSSQPGDRTCVSSVSCIGRWVLYHSHHLGSPSLVENPNLEGISYFIFNRLVFFLFFLESAVCAASLLQHGDCV